MSKPLRIKINKVECLAESLEDGNDEISIFGYAVDGAGTRYFISPIDLGSFGEGGVKTYSPPQPLLDTMVSDSVNIAACCFFLIERDNGDALDFARNSQEYFSDDWSVGRDNLDPDMREDQKNLYAFAQAMIRMTSRIFNVNTFGNSDEKSIPVYRTINARLDRPIPFDPTQDNTMVFTSNGTYNIYVTFELPQTLVIG